MDHLLEAKKWLEHVEDEDLKSDLTRALGDEKELEDKFYKHLEFGTGGLRGILGAGTNCLNVYTVARATEGVAHFMKKHKLQAAAISYDSRIRSDEFAQTAACVLAENGVTVYIVKELMPTPFLSFITREYQCGMGIMITASHNPAAYNGYKVYGSDGCQITDQAAAEISEEIGKCGYFTQNARPFEEYLREGKIIYCKKESEEKYLAAVKALSTGEMSGLKVTYSALNGTGWRIVPRLLKERGVGELKTVAEQSVPDGRFPTCPYPNPEKKEALALGLRDAEKNGSDILLATDPDADRVGVAVRHENSYRLLTGNETGVLLADYLLSRKKAAGTLPARPVLIKTIVTTDLVRKICGEYGCEVVEVLTGFKYIGEQIGRLEKEGRAQDFILGFEESYGYLMGTNVRDKDAVVAVQAVCEMAAYYKARGKTLVDVLQAIYEKYGLYEHTLYSFEFPGSEGSRTMQRILKTLRENAPEEICRRKVVEAKDYLEYQSDILPRANVLSYRLQGGASLVVRPSGTEPLIKVYLTLSETKEKNERDRQLFHTYLKTLFQDRS